MALPVLSFRSRRASLPCALVLASLQGACYAPPGYTPPASADLATSEIGFDLRLTQEEAEGEVLLVARARAYREATGRTEALSLSATDSVVITAPGQATAPPPAFTIADSGETFFTLDLATSTLPLTLRVQLLRGGARTDAADTYVTLPAVFETLSPRDGDAFALDADVPFGWTLRDGDGNARAPGIDLIDGATSAIPPSASVIDGNAAPFARFEPLADDRGDGTRRALVDASTMVPLAFLDDGSWELVVRLERLGDDGALEVPLPATVDVDSALANVRAGDAFATRTVAVPRQVSIRVR